MTQTDRLGAWCGWVLLGGLALTPLMAWLGPQGLWLPPALIGLLCLPALRLTREDRPVLAVLILALAWAVVSTTWSPFTPKTLDRSTALKIAVMLLLFWSAICAARRADPRLAALAGTVLAWGLAVLGALLLIESATGGVIYRALHVALYQPIRIDLAQKNIAQTTFALAVLWPVAMIGRLRRPLDAVLLSVAALGCAVAARRFDADAPVIAVPLAALAAFAVWRCPKLIPRIFAAKAAALILLMPGVLWLLRAWPGHQPVVDAMPLSWSMRVGYWSNALDRIALHPWRGWGLDASRTMAPAIQLHPHNGALQFWLELGVVGALAAAAVWGLSLLRLSAPTRSLAAAGAAGSAAAYLVFALLNFGVWQEWWLGLAAMIAVLTALSRTTALST
jgi:O-antigen ligase